MIFSGRSSYAWLVRETFITSNGFFSKSRSNAVHCPKRNPNFRDKTWNVEENEILHEIFRWVSQLPRYISCNIAKNVLPVGQCILDRLRNMNRFDGFVWWVGAQLRMQQQGSECSTLIIQAMGSSGLSAHDEAQHFLQWNMRDSRFAQVNPNLSS